MKRFLSLAFVLVILTSLTAQAQVSVTGLRCENQKDPIGIGTAKPRLSWQLVANRRNVSQTAYEIRVSSQLANLKEGGVWKSGKVTSDQSVFIPYAGETLQSGAPYYWQVRVWDEGGKASEWSQPARWQMGLLSPADWKAEWIQSSQEESDERPSPLFRKRIAFGKKIKQATAFITAHGLYEAFINGKRVGDFYLTPGWTSYNKRLQYQAYDVTDLLQQGDNVL
ncbi:MAG: alpha-L-rhamnosidase N-terminal domain-containing protein, partial [Bacteroidota bacterium]|nr:alpha-L-rhamnosidase N-terminal domain-containing protein [Bacteroidota bacterium]